jgi:hypothetical protein
MVNSTLTTSTEVVASLEGMKIVLKSQRCELHEYNFEENCWHELDRSARPMRASEAEMWVAGWNDLDRQAALRLLSDEFAK